MVTEKYLTVAEVADKAKVRSETVLRWIHFGRLSAVALQGGHYRIAESEMEKIMQSVPGAVPRGD